MAPPETTLELTLRGSKRLRRRTLAIVAPMLLLALPVAMASIAAAVGNPDITPTGRYVLVGIGVGLAGGIGWWARLRLRLAFKRGRLVLGATTMRIEHAGLLRRSYELPRSLLRAAVGDPEGGRDPLGRPARFMLTTTPWDGPGSGDDWLWAAGETPVMPFLGVEVDVPNLVLVFEHPLEGPTARFGAGHAPLPGEAIGGLMLAVEAPADLEQSLTALGFERSLTRADLRRHRRRDPRRLLVRGLDRRQRRSSSIAPATHTAAPTAAPATINTISSVPSRPRIHLNAARLSHAPTNAPNRPAPILRAAIRRASSLPGAATIRRRSIPRPTSVGYEPPAAAAQLRRAGRDAPSRR